MIFIVIPILFVMFLSTRYGIKSASKSIRILSYAGIFLSIVLMTLLAFALIAERFQD